jgi:hypothetical protein
MRRIYAGRDLSQELGFGQTKVRRARLASEDAKRVARNKMALNVESILDDGVNRQKPLR